MTDSVKGQHLLIDLHGASGLSDAKKIERAMRAAVTAIGATLLSLDVHRFGGEGGVTGVAMLAESHLSIHTWPEQGFAAVDVFVCGQMQPDAAVAVFEDALSPSRSSVRVVARG
jgi:S-adenosylmethionine decarboxylase